MEMSLDKNNSTDNKHIEDDSSQTKNINSYLDLITSSEQKSQSLNNNESKSEQNFNTSPQNGIISTSEVEKGQQEVESRVKELSLEGPPKSTNDADDYNFTEDQKRAMMELLTQNEEDADLLDEEPPEYNVKSRLIQLNEELAKDPTPVEVNREHKVGFKPKIVDLVAFPSPEISENGQHSNDIKDETVKSADTSTNDAKKNGKNISNEKVVDDGKESKESKGDKNQNQYVVEKDGHFYVVDRDEFNSMGMGTFSDDVDKKMNGSKQSEVQNTKESHKSQIDKEKSELSGTWKHNTPIAPAEPRPKSGVTVSRRGLHSDQSRQSRSAGHSSETRSKEQQNSSSSCLVNFRYVSPYAMTPDQKTFAREEARKVGKERKEAEEKHKLEEEERRRESNSAFNTWLEMKKKEQEKQRQEQESQKQMEKHDKKEENEEAINDWLKKKETQIKQEKLLNRRQQQEQSDWTLLRSRDECEKVYKEWLKKKSREKKKQQQMDKQRYKLYRIQVKRSRKTLALIKALKEAHCIRYAEYYNCRI